MADKHHGSCLCGAVRYEVTGDFDAFFLCHCSYCQKDTGSAHAANLFSTKAALSWLEGDTNIQSFTVPGTRHQKAFCQACGSAVPYTQMDGKLVVVPAGSLETPVSIRPTAHIMMGSKANWDEGLEDIDRLDGLPA
ncbi:GFA family protein [Thalassospira sp.]|uniref:GFA family protein n=1 Tax=Thalassospira sp. TaxID=1912094 RepID=UPI000C4D967B|nr:GFA family protein [Thalassospira sp.]MBC07330.1 aldehyde-activating protein [Thalassospira sp.]|tara:strand:+ start:1754 stop:2161 length:408 start_codon:yes stop_codon:yes gene_type:complete